MVKIDNLETGRRSAGNEPQRWGEAPDRALTFADLHRGGDLWLLLRASGFTPDYPIPCRAEVADILCESDNIMWHFCQYNGRCLALGLYFHSPLPWHKTPPTNRGRVTIRSMLVGMYGHLSTRPYTCHFDLFNVATEHIMERLVWAMDQIDDIEHKRQEDTW